MNGVKGRSGKERNKEKEIYFGKQEMRKFEDFIVRGVAVCLGRRIQVSRGGQNYKSFEKWGGGYGWKDWVKGFC